MGERGGRERSERERRGGKERSGRERGGREGGGRERSERERGGKERSGRERGARERGGRERGGSSGTAHLGQHGPGMGKIYLGHVKISTYSQGLLIVMLINLITAYTKINHCNNYSSL